MERFHIIEDAAVILRSKGNFRQARVYRRGEGVYGQWAGGYIRLTSGGGTTNPNVVWIEYEAEGVANSKTGTPTFITISAVAA